MVVIESVRTGTLREAPPGQRVCRILLVEDETIIRELLADHLAADGFVVDGAASIPQAIKRVAIAAPEVIVLDLMLPGHSGLDFLKERAADPMLACIPVVVISAASDRYLHEAESLGADAVLGKPFDLDALSTAVRKIVS